MPSSSPPQMMRGAYVIKRALSEYLSQVVPENVAMAAEMWDDQQEGSIKEPVLYDADGPDGVNDDQYPAIGSYATRAGRYRRLDILSDGSIEYQSEWQVYTFVAYATQLLPDDGTGFDRYESPGRAQTIQRCADMSSIVQNTLLQNPDLGTDGDFVIKEESMSVEFQQPLQLQGSFDRWVCTALISYTVTLKEVAVILPMGVADQVTVQIDRL